MPSPLIYPKFQAINPTLIGSAAAGFKLKTFAAGTSTPLATYTDATLAVANPTTIIMDAAGQANVWLGQLAYKFVFTDAADVVQWTVDNVTQASLGQTASEWIQLPSPTFISATSFSVGGGVTDLTVTPYFLGFGTRIKTVNSGGTIYSTIPAQVGVISGNIISSLRNDSGVLDAGLSAAYYGVVTGPNNSIRQWTRVGYISGSNVNMVNTSPVQLASGGSLILDALGECTAFGQLTVHQAGIYKISGFVLMNEGAATTGIQNVAQTVSIRKNGASIKNTTINWPIAPSIGSTQAVPFETHAALIAADFIDISVTMTFTGTAPTAALAALSIERVL